MSITKLVEVAKLTKQTDHEIVWKSSLSQFKAKIDDITWPSFFFLMTIKEKCFCQKKVSIVSLVNISINLYSVCSGKSWHIIDLTLLSLHFLFQICFIFKKCSITLIIYQNKCSLLAKECIFFKPFGFFSLSFSNTFQYVYPMIDGQERRRMRCWWWRWWRRWLWWWWWWRRKIKALVCDSLFTASCNHFLPFTQSVR